MFINPFFKSLENGQTLIPLHKDNNFKIKMYLQKIFHNEKHEIFGENEKHYYDIEIIKEMDYKIENCELHFNIVEDTNQYKDIYNNNKHFYDDIIKERLIDIDNEKINITIFSDIVKSLIYNFNNIQLQDIIDDIHNNKNNYNIIKKLSKQTLIDKICDDCLLHTKDLNKSKHHNEIKINDKDATSSTYLNIQ